MYPLRSRRYPVMQRIPRNLHDNSYQMFHSEEGNEPLEPGEWYAAAAKKGRCIRTRIDRSELLGPNIDTFPMLPRNVE